MNVDVQIYISNFIKFFNDNPNELKQLIGIAKPDDFYEYVEKVSNDNFENGEDFQLTQKQIIKIVVELNHMGMKEEEVKVNLKPYYETSYGLIFLTIFHIKTLLWEFTTKLKIYTLTELTVSLLLQLQLIEMKT